MCIKRNMKHHSENNHAKDDIKQILFAATTDRNSHGNPDYRIKKMIELKKIIEICETNAGKKR